MNNENNQKNSAPEGGTTLSEDAVLNTESEPKTEPQMDVKTSPAYKRKFPSWVDLFALVGVFILSSLLGSLVALVGWGGELPPQATLVYYIVQMLPSVVFLVWLRRRAGRSGGIHLGFRQINLPLLLWGVVLLVASSFVIEPLLMLFPTEAYDAVTNVVGKGVWAVLSVVVCAPVLEEILFRGLIFESCRERFGGGGAVLISALLFGLVHGVPVQIINAFVVGIILGFIYLRTRSLASVMLLHAINNGIAYLTMGLEVDTMRELIKADWLYWTIYAVAAVVFVLSMIKVVVALRDSRELE